MNKTIEREIEVIIYGQSVRFRIIKYIVILIIVAILHHFMSWKYILYILAASLFVGGVVHFFFRWKTNGWKNVVILNRRQRKLES